MGPMADGQRPPLVTRMRLARRAAQALLPQEGDVLIEAQTSGDPLSGDKVESLLRTDFLITVLDLRVRVALLPGSHDSSILFSPDVEQAATKLLWDNPETLACLLVADDESLSSRIIEFGEAEVNGDVEAAREVRPIREQVGDYFARLRPSWPPPPPLGSSDNLSFEEVMIHSAQEAVSARKAMASRVDERKRARAELSHRDSSGIADLIRMVIRREDDAFSASLEQRLQDPR